MPSMRGSSARGKAAKARTSSEVVQNRISGLCHCYSRGQQRMPTVTPRCMQIRVLQLIIVVAGGTRQAARYRRPRAGPDVLMAGSADILCGTMSLAALQALIAGVKVRCGVVGGPGEGPQWGRHGGGRRGGQ